MTRITGFNPPANLKALLGDSLKTNKASKYASAAAYPSRHRLKAKGKGMSWAHPLNFGEAARWMIEHGPAAWRDGSIPGLRTRILASIANRTFDPELWTRAPVATDRIEVCYPEIERYWGEGPDPLIPDDTANTHCVYDERSTFWPYDQAKADGWPPLPGWQAEIDADRWFIDLWQAQRSLTYPLPPLTIDDRKDFVVLHLQGTITASADQSGVKVWFPALLRGTWHYNSANADSHALALGSQWNGLFDANLVLPPPTDGWSYTLPINAVYLVRTNTGYHWNKTFRWFNLKLGTHPPCGKYRAKNTWARSIADLTPTIYYPAFIV